MFILYKKLAKDEERRMLSQFGDGYRRYMSRTGMCLPRSIEARFYKPFELLRGHGLRAFVITLCIPVLVVGTGFVLRAITLRSLLLEANRNVRLVFILPEDSVFSPKLMEDVFQAAVPGAPLSFFGVDKDYLGYVMPPDYVLQGMIANTGGAFHLHQQHHTSPSSLTGSFMLLNTCGNLLQPGWRLCTMSIRLWREGTTVPSPPPIRHSDVRRALLAHRFRRDQPQREWTPVQGWTLLPSYNTGSDLLCGHQHADRGNCQGGMRRTSDRMDGCAHSSHLARLCLALGF